MPAVPVTRALYDVHWDDGNVSEFGIDLPTGMYDAEDVYDLFWDYCDPRVQDKVKLVEVKSFDEAYMLEEARQFLSREEVFELIEGERRYQDNKWGGPNHDEHHTNLEWGSYIMNYLGKYTHWDSTPLTQQSALIKIAALATAALEHLEVPQEA